MNFNCKTPAPITFFCFLSYRVILTLQRTEVASIGTNHYFAYILHSVTFTKLSLLFWSHTHQDLSNEWSLDIVSLNFKYIL